MSFIITVDSRESRSGVPGWLLRLGYQTEVAQCGRKQDERKSNGNEN